MSRVDVLLPSYGHARFLAEAIDSVLRQSLTDWRLFVRDDRSPDASLDIARSFRDERIVAWVGDSNLGTYGSLQEALSRGDAPLVAVLNSDDRWHPEKLACGVEAMAGHAALAHRGRLIDADGAVVEGDPHGDWPAEGWTARLAEENRILASSVLFRREGLAFRPALRYSGDWVALIEAAVRGPLGFLDEALSDWRVHGGNAHLRSAAQVAEEVAVREWILASGFGDAGSRARCRDHLVALRLLRGEPPGRAGTFRRALRARLGGRAALWPGVLPVPAVPLPDLD